MVSLVTMVTKALRLIGKSPPQNTRTKVLIKLHLVKTIEI